MNACPPHLTTLLIGCVDAAMEKSTFSPTATVFQLHNLKQLSRFVAYKMVLCVQKHRFQAGQFSSSVYKQQEHYISH